MLENVKFKLLNFDNEGQAQIAVKDLKALVESPGWKFLIERVIDLNIRMLRKDLETDETLTKEENDIKKRDLRFLRNLMRLPQMQMDVLAGKTPALETLDPYFSDVEQFEKETGMTVVDVEAPKEPTATPAIPTPPST